RFHPELLPSLDYRGTHPGAFLAQGGRFMTLPGRLRNPGNLSAQRQPAKAQPADAELAQVSPRTSAQLAAVMPARGKFWGRALTPRFVKLGLNLCVFHSFCSSQFAFSSQLPAAALSCQPSALSSDFSRLRPERHSQMLQQH